MDREACPSGVAGWETATVRHVDRLTQLVLEARAGSATALAQFVRESQPEVWRLCRHIAGADDADDATQEVYLAAWRELPRFRGASSARTWLFTIARRSASRTARRRRRWQELTAGAADLGAPRSGGHAPFSQVPPSQDRALEVSSLLAELDEDRRFAFVLTQLLGFSYEETASICQCPVGTIRSRVARARADLVAAVGTGRSGTGRADTGRSA